MYVVSAYMVREKLYVLEKSRVLLKKRRRAAYELLQRNKNVHVREK
jgi:hypothetical protein